MKFLRLRLGNYRGVDHCEVDFIPKGLTIVEGPNESGKTSLWEAVNILFQYVDSSRHKDVLAIRPVHRDEGPEIELTAESGPYVFTYTKRFLKKPETRLVISRPRPENRVGREAHDRAEVILQETLDRELWKALGIQQGEAIAQANLSGKMSLSTALDQAAGGSSSDPKEEGLFDKVRREYGRYFTDQGSEKKELIDNLSNLKKAEEEVASLTEKLRGLEADVSQLQNLQKELERLEEQEGEQILSVAEYGRLLEDVQSLEADVKAARLQWEKAQAAEQASGYDLERRQELIKAVVEANKRLLALSNSGEEQSSRLKTTETIFRKAQVREKDVETQKGEAERLWKIRRNDSEYYEKKLDLEQFKERKERVDQARKEAALAGEILRTNQVDDRMLKEIERANQALIVAEAKRESGVPSVVLRGQKDLDLQIDGKVTRVREKEEKRLTVSDSLRLGIPGLLDIEITAGIGAGDLSKNVELTRRTFNDLCGRVGVKDLSEAQKTYAERQEAQKVLRNKGEVEKADLRDLSYEDIERNIIGLSKGVSSYLDRRPEEPQLSLDLRSAKEALRIAQESMEKANQVWEDAKSALDSARDIWDEMKEVCRESEVQYRVETDNLKRAQETLEHARTKNADETLKEAHERVSQAVSLKERALHSIEDVLQKKQPDQIKTFKETAEQSLQATRGKRVTVKSEIDELRGVLRHSGEDGLHEKLQVANGRSGQIRNSNEALLRRTSAAKLLYETMREERDRARRAYVAPLKERIDRLGRLIHDESFEVEVGEDLSIVNRTLNGITVPFASLSGGTKEQLCLIVRLACAMAVAKDGGAPLILDDALGYTDPERLKRMGAVLSKAGQECQVIILTCVPDRYSNVGKAHVIRLASKSSPHPSKDKALEQTGSPVLQ